MATIRVLKGSRNIEFPEGITKAELVTILLKWAPKIAGDDDKTPYGIVGVDPTREPSPIPDIFGSSLDDVVDMLNGIGE